MKKVLLILVAALLIAIGIRSTVPNSQAAFDSPLPSIGQSPLIYYMPVLHGPRFARPDPSEHLIPSTRE